MQLIVVGILGLAACYLAVLGVALLAMLQPPERFGSFMRHMPAALLGVLPVSRMWLWARRGELIPGSAAPDFTLPRHGLRGRVTLSSHRGQRPVVLVFGSYT